MIQILLLPIYILQGYIFNYLITRRLYRHWERLKILWRKAPEKERLSIESLYAVSVEKNPQKRLILLEKLVDMYPGEKRFHNDLGVVYQFMNRNEEAKKEFIEAINLDPNFAAPTNGLSYIYAAQGLYGKAIETQKRYADLSPGDANPFDSMGEIVYFIMGDYEKSIESYLKVFTGTAFFFPFRCKSVICVCF